MIIMLHMINKQVFICVQYAFFNPDATTSRTLGLSKKKKKLLYDLYFIYTYFFYCIDRYYSWNIVTLLFYHNRSTEQRRK